MPKKALIVIDMSVEQVANITYRKQKVIDTIQRLATSDVFDLILDSHLWIGPSDTTSLRRLYPDGRMDSEGAQLIPQLRKSLSGTAASSYDEATATPCEFVRKYNYSSFAQPSNISEVLRAHRIEDVYLCGINTDYCVFATAMDAFYACYNVFVVEEGVTSVGGAAGHRQGLEQMDKFGCAKVVTAGSILENEK